MLWDIIRDWFVQYVWGGTTSTNSVFENTIGGENLMTSDLVFNIGDNSINIGNWLSTTSTIIVLCALVLFLFLVVRYLFRLTSGLIRGQ